jgi:polyhydroxyalkanoate synthesis regulator phasin
MIKKGIRLGITVASLVKKHAGNHVKHLVKKGYIKAPGAKRVVDAVFTEAKKEGKKLEFFMMQELKKELKKIKPFIKKSIRNR